MIHSNPLRGPADVADWVAEGPVQLAAQVFEAPDDGGPGLGADGSSALVLSGSLDAKEHGDHAHWTLWCPQELPDHVRISWEFLPMEEPGLAMVFFAARGHGGEDLFSSALAPRTGFYPQYHSGDIDALHVSYFRHKHSSERAFRTCNLRKSAGFELVAQGADPLPPAEDADGFYGIEVVKDGPRVAFSINGLPLFEWMDPSPRPLGGGYFGIRQMAPLKAAYRNLSITDL
ncbi:YesU family protein [Arthrobacter sp. R3-55]